MYYFGCWTSCQNERKRVSRMKENAYLSIKTPKAFRTTKGLLCSHDSALLCRQFSASEAGPPLDQILDLHLVYSCLSVQGVYPSMHLDRGGMYPRMHLGRMGGRVCVWWMGRGWIWTGCVWMWGVHTPVLKPPLRWPLTRSVNCFNEHMNLHV